MINDLNFPTVRNVLKWLRKKKFLGLNLVTEGEHGSVLWRPKGPHFILTVFFFFGTTVKTSCKLRKTQNLTVLQDEFDAAVFSKQYLQLLQTLYDSIIFVPVTFKYSFTLDRMSMHSSFQSIYYLYAQQVLCLFFF